MCKRIPSRAWVAMMIFWGTFVNYMFRTHYQISLLAMIKPKDNKTVEDYGTRLDWSSTWEQQSISAQFYGLAIISIPAGIIISWLGPWHVLFWSTVIMAIVTDIIVPMALYVGPGGVLFMRILVGMMVGLQYPAMQNLASNWSPPQEKGKFTSCLMGNAFGSILTMPFTSFIIEKCGWPWSFYYLTVVAIVFCTALYLLVADHPRTYRWIRSEELEMIEASHEGTVNTATKRGNPPYFRMIKSRSFWAVIVAQFGNQYNLFLALTTVPQYLKKRLQFDLKASAGIAALPHVARLLFGFTYGIANDWLLRRGVPKKYCRRVFTIFSHILTGITLCLFLSIGDCSTCAILLLILMMIFNGGAVVSVLINPQDLAPNWSGTIYSIMNFFGSWGGFIGPILVNALTTENKMEQWAIVPFYKHDKQNAPKEIVFDFLPNCYSIQGNKMEQWAIVFCVGGVIGIVTGIFFIFLGAFEIQPWNEPEDKPDEDADKK